MFITLVTISVSSYRVSQMNIVQAVRGLPEVTTVSSVSWQEVVLVPLRAIALPFQLAGRGVRDLVTVHPMSALTYLPRMLWALLSIPTAIMGTIFQIFWRPFRQGWLAFLLGLLVTWLGMVGDQTAPFRIGVSLVILGLGLMMRTALQRTSMRDEVGDRIAYTFIGLVMLIFWILPFDIVRSVAGGDLGGGIELFFISGVAMVAAAVWTLMYNSDLLLKGLSFVVGHVGQLRPVMVTAVAYPMSAKFRTGLTLAMFALVIFTLIVMSILTNAFDVSSLDQETVTGGWDIEGTLNFSTPIENIDQAIDEEPDLNIQDFEAIGGYTTIPVQARQIGVQDQLWRGYAVRAADQSFLEATNYKFKLIADGYGPTDEDVWEALRADPSLAVVEALVVPRRSGFAEGNASFQMEGFFYEDDTMPATDIEIREPRTGEIVPLKVIGVLNQLTDDFGVIGVGMFTSKANLDNSIPFPVPIITYRFRVAEGLDVGEASRGLEASFQEHGMETVVLEEVIEENAAANKAFNYIFTGFMGLGLLVGIAALGVISLRAVVERRQQIGVLRAIGYRRRMIQLSFLLESSFIALLGVAIGVALGTVISYNIVSDVRERENVETLRFSIPWLQIVIIIAVAYVFSLITTFLPARQASRIYPAEALRYE
ncbi:MAG: ABC transporter permease [Dehalococcoidia bacterium]|nr:ABC transporter permease [Dehalococcoidia bacterium]